MPLDNLVAKPCAAHVPLRHPAAAIDQIHGAVEGFFVHNECEDYPSPLVKRAAVNQIHAALAEAARVDKIERTISTKRC